MVEWLPYCVCIRWNSVQSSTPDSNENLYFVTFYKFLPHIGLHHTRYVQSNGITTTYSTLVTHILKR
jgi:hypothetical protein